MVPRLSLILPVRNESAILAELLGALQPLRTDGVELIVVDGQSDDDSADIAGPLVDRVLRCSPGRARQMNLGAAQANGPLLWFVHADSQADWPLLAAQLLRPDAGQWGRFDVRLDDERWPYRLIGWAMNRRSCLTGIATGDQGLFVERALFQRVGGFPEQPLMEDVEISRRLKRLCRPRCLRLPIVTSARRWRRNGLLRTVLLMWGLRLAYFLGVSAQRLARWYRPCHSSNGDAPPCSSPTRAS